MPRMIHRHIGGLESNTFKLLGFVTIHRHIGGLETEAGAVNIRFAIHRHIGGLENFVFFSVVSY